MDAFRRATAMAFLRLLIIGFIAGSLAVLIFHQSLWYVLNVMGLIPLERPARPLEPIPPLGIPSILSKAFWGGVWGALLAPILNLRGAAYWIGWIVVGALCHYFCSAVRLAADQERAYPAALATACCRPYGERHLGLWYGFVLEALSRGPAIEDPA